MKVKVAHQGININIACTAEEAEIVANCIEKAHRILASIPELDRSAEETKELLTLEQAMRAFRPQQ